MGDEGELNSGNPSCVKAVERHDVTYQLIDKFQAPLRSTDLTEKSMYRELPTLVLVSRLGRIY